MAVHEMRQVTPDNWARTIYDCIQDVYATENFNWLLINHQKCHVKVDAFHRRGE